MKIVFLDFKDLSARHVHDMLRLRQQVFIIEQDCLYEDIDGADPKAGHLLLYENKVLAGYLRIFPPGIKYEEASMGRIVVKDRYRGTGVGRALIKKGIECCEGSAVRIEAQAPLKKYYNQFGFKEEGSIYVVDGIDHIQMVLKTN